MKRSVILSVLISMSVLSGCEIDKPVSNNNTNSATQTTKTEHVSPVKQLTDADFIIHDKIPISLDTAPSAVFKTLGDGGANENNNWGFINNDPTNQYAFYGHNYGSFEIITRMSVISNHVELSQITLTQIPTARGIKVGDLLNKLESIYGLPTKIDRSSPPDVWYLYEYDGKSIEFNISQSKISDIMIVRAQNN